jgi:hypothetical protein
MLADMPLVSPDNLDALRAALQDVDTGAAHFNTPDVENRGYMLPNCVYVPGHCHVIFNALEEAISDIPAWKAFEVQLRGITAFLGNRGLRQRFQKLCCPSELVQRKFGGWHKEHVSWRWEYLEDVLTPLMGLLPDLLKHFNISIMRGGHAPLKGDPTRDEISNARLKVVADVQMDQLFGVKAELFRVVAH